MAAEHSNHHGRGASDVGLAREKSVITSTPADGAGAGPGPGSASASGYATAPISTSTSPRPPNAAAHSTVFAPAPALDTISLSIVARAADELTEANARATSSPPSTAANDDEHSRSVNTNKTSSDRNTVTVSGTDSDMSNNHPHHPPWPGPPAGAQHPASYSSSSVRSHPNTPATANTGSPAAAYHPTTNTPEGYSSNTYSSYPAQHQQLDSYHATSGHGNMSLPLPSIRTIDPAPQQTPHSLGSSSGLGISGLPMPPIAGGVQYYHHQPTGPPSTYVFPAAPHDPSMPHRTPKKVLDEHKRVENLEIKRRTKTGCLTCRKRRIKCDEGHPTCNNCKRSKRECLGYDPVFRPQAGRTPDSPSDQHSTSAAVSTTSTDSQPASALPPHHPAGSVSPSVPELHPPTQGIRASLLPSTYTPPPLRGTSSAPIKRDTLDLTRYSPVAVKVEPGVGQSSFAPSDFRMPTLPATTTGTPSYDINSHRLRATKMRIEEILTLLGPPPPPPEAGVDAALMTEITRVYHEVYAGALCAFFETRWYDFSADGHMVFPQSAALIDHMASFLKVLESIRANDHTQMAYSGALETRIVWELARTASAVEQPNPAMRVMLPHDSDPAEARSRLQVVEALICGETLASNPLCPPYQDPDIHRSRQFDFWYHLAEFVRRREDPYSQDSVKARDDILARLRQLLDGRENRDVLYSIAVVRELAPQFEPNYANTVPPHLDEADPKNRLAVASKFIVDESQVTGGTTNVVRRFSDIAARAFVNPGVNVSRPA